MTLVSLLESVGETIESRYKNVNCGGCGVVAVHLGRALEALGVSCEPVVMGYKDFTDEVFQYQRERKSDVILELRNNGSFCISHVVLRVNLGHGSVCYVDSEGVYTTFQSAVRAFLKEEWGGFETREPTFGLSLDDLELEVNRADNWNSWFDRSQIPGIAKTIRTHFSLYKRANRRGVGKEVGRKVA